MPQKSAERPGRSSEAVRPKYEPPESWQDAGDVYRGSTPDHLRTTYRPDPLVDLSLGARRGINRIFLALARTLPGRLFLAANFRAAMPPLALSQGEELIGSPRRVLALTAHPDDLEFFAGGTLHRMAQTGSKIFAYVLSDGEKHGSYAQMGNVRREEQKRAAQLQGFHSVRFMAFPDFTLPEDPRVEATVKRAWQHVKPDVVFAFDPQELIARMANRDHKALGRTVMDLARHYSGTRTRVYFYGTRQPNVVVDITPVMEAKLRVVECHASQLVYLTGEEYRQGFRLFAQAYATGTGRRYGEGLYRLM